MSSEGWSDTLMIRNEKGTPISTETCVTNNLKRKRHTRG